MKCNGHQILHIHLGQRMKSETDDPHWKALRKVLEYLTDPENFHEKHVDIALSIVKGTGFICVALALCVSLVQCLCVVLFCSLSLSLRPILYTHETPPSPSNCLWECPPPPPPFSPPFLPLPYSYKISIAFVFFSDTSHNYELIRCSADLSASVISNTCIAHGPKCSWTQGFIV